jgi:hypothetical protein
VQVDKAEILGGAERIAWLLHRGYRDRGDEAWLAVDEKSSDEPEVLQIRKGRGGARWGGYGRRAAAGRGTDYELMGTNPGAFRRAILGQDSFAYPETRQLAQLPPVPPQTGHAHNLHGSYFDLPDAGAAGTEGAAGGDGARCVAVQGCIYASVGVHALPEGVRALSAPRGALSGGRGGFGGV